MLDLIKAVVLATEAHIGQYRARTKVFPVNEHTLSNHEITKLQQNNGTDFSICKEDGEYSMNTYLELFIAEPYINHPLAVMNMMTTEEEKIVAVLHDVFEKCPGYALGRVMNDSAHWIKIGSTMTDIPISQRMFWMLSVLSKDKHISYDYYIKCLIRSCILANNKVPIKVKLADIIHNLSGSPSEHAKQKYMKAIPLLLNSL